MSEMQDKPPTMNTIGAQLCRALGLKNVTSLKIEIDNDTLIGYVTAVQYLGAEHGPQLNKVLRQYRLELLEETPLPTPDVEVFLDGRVNTYRLPAQSQESDPT